MDFNFEQFISMVGLPGAICLYTLVFMRKTVESNTKVMWMIAAKMGVRPDDLGEDAK